MVNKQTNIRRAIEKEKKRERKNKNNVMLTITTTTEEAKFQVFLRETRQITR